MVCVCRLYWKVHVRIILHNTIRQLKNRKWTRCTSEHIVIISHLNYLLSFNKQHFQHEYIYIWYNLLLLSTSSIHKWIWYFKWKGRNKYSPGVRRKEKEKKKHSYYSTMMKYLSSLTRFCLCQINWTLAGPQFSVCSSSEPDFCEYSNSDLASLRSS